MKHGSLLKALLFIAFYGVTKQRFSNVSREVKQPSPEFLLFLSLVLSIFFNNSFGVINIPSLCVFLF